MIREYFGKTDQGPHLNINEDSYFVDLSNLIFAVCDGMGGVNIGDKACRDIEEKIKTSYTDFTKDPDSTLPFFYNPKFMLEANALINSLHSAHRDMINENKKLEFSKRAAVAGVFGVFSKNVLTTVSLGNLLMIYEHKGEFHIHIAPEVLSPFYFGHNGESILQNMYPLNAIGLHEDLIFQVKELKVNPGDRLYVFTDGIFPYFSYEELCSELKEGNPSKTVGYLVEQSNDRGNKDNQTSLVVEF